MFDCLNFIGVREKNRKDNKPLYRNKLTFSNNFKHLSICLTLVTESLSDDLPLAFKHLLQETTGRKIQGKRS